uniref:Uncharacterized protein n=1 Tax=Arundo donax TaxID=35708 RepID=A0A0A9G3G9_ARUDO
MKYSCFIFTPLNFSAFCLPDWMRPLRSWNTLLECERRSWEQQTQTLATRSEGLRSY